LACNPQNLTHQISDDGYANVPLQFQFPFYNETFNNSWMFSNGIISFQDPQQSGLAWQNLGVQPFGTHMGSAFNYSIYPLWTDLINLRGSFTTQGTQEYQRYNWIGISPYADSSRINTFSVELRPDGRVLTTYNAVSVNYGFSGVSGNISRGEYSQFLASSGPVFSAENWESVAQPRDPCIEDPLSSPSCSGYAQAYLQQQCNISALYSPLCSGYGAAIAIRLLTAQPEAVAPAEVQQQVEQEAEQETLAETQQVPVTEAASTRPDGRKPTVNARVLALAAASAANQLAESVAAESSLLSERLSLQQSQNNEENSYNLELQQQTKASLNLIAEASFTNIQDTSDQKPGSSVRGGGRVDGLSGGPDPKALAAAPVGFSDYLSQQLKDVQFYSITQAYKNQRTVDNQRLLRGLAANNDRRHQQLIDAQYTSGGLNVTKP
jgi:hypothetical protein